MTQICVLIKFKHDTERNTYSWLYTGGCYKGNDPVNYEDAKPLETKNFKDVQFEVRLDHRSFEEITLLPGLDDDDDDGLDDDVTTTTPTPVVKKNSVPTRKKSTEDLKVDVDEDDDEDL